MQPKLVDALGWLGTGLVFGAVVARFVLPEQQELWRWLTIAGLVVLVVYALGQWRHIATFFSRRQAQQGTIAMTSVLLALGIVVAANYVFARRPVRWDLTAARQYSLSDQTRRVLESLESPIQIYVFAREDAFARFRDRLDEYAYVSSQVSVEYVDVDRNPLLAQRYEVQVYGTIVLEHEGRVERVTSDAEQDLTNALIKAVEGEEQTVYFVQGHGERSPDSADRDGYGAVTEALRLDNLTVEPVVLAQTGEVPEDVAVLVVAGPTTDFLPAEVDLMRTYLEAGGKALFLIDPPTAIDAMDNMDNDETGFPNLIGLLGEWGIEIGTDIVVDVSGVGQLLGTDATVPVAASYPPHPITDRFNLLTAYPLARSVRPASGAPAGRAAETFIETSPRSWAERDLSELASGEVAMNPEAGDLQGPVSIGVAVSVAVEPPDAADDSEETDAAPPTQARVAVIGDSDFASNGAIGIQGNRDLALNTINWLAQQENLIAIRPREPEDRRITLTADQQIRINWLSLLMIPGVILGTGVYTWWRRR